MSGDSKVSNGPESRNGGRKVALITGITGQVYNYKKKGAIKKYLN